MSLIQRFTRDGASKYIWAAMSLAAIIGLAYATITGNRVLDEERAVSEGRAVRYVDEVLAPRLASPDLAGSIELAAPLTGGSADSLKVFVDLLILTDARVERVRIWSTDGALLFSTDQKDPIGIGTKTSLNDPVLRRASRQGPISPSDLSDTGGPNDPERSLFRTYVPLGAEAVAEIDQTDEGTVAQVRSEWRSYQILAGALVLLFLTMSALSLRDPIAPINVGVPSAGASLPAGFSLIDDDRLHSVQEVYRLASQRVKRLQEKLSESEEARRRLEGDVQRAQSKAGSSATRAAASVARPGAPPAPEPTVVQVPESQVVADEPLGEARVAARAGQRARGSRHQKSSSTTGKERPAGQEPKRAAKQRKARSETPAAAPRQDANPPSAAASITSDLEIDDSRDHAVARETSTRLKDVGLQPQDTIVVDPKVVRAALARTAARKKPSEERLHPHDLPDEESPGDPPTGTD